MLNTMREAEQKVVVELPHSRWTFKYDILKFNLERKCTKERSTYNLNEEVHTPTK